MSVVRSAVFFFRFDGSKYKLFRDCCFREENLYIKHIRVNTINGGKLTVK